MTTIKQSATTYLHKKVLICGSRSVTALPDEVCKTLDKIIAFQVNILIGDADGVDRLVQKYLHSKRYRKVTVYYAKSGLRSNIGKWTSIRVAGNYIDRDKLMCDKANWCVAVHKGNSRGTKRNIESFKPEAVKVFIL
ncbi:MAG: hypothetical protein AAGJ08_13885 [Cyanobacteria bacterium P01_H01_bin.35]